MPGRPGLGKAQANVVDFDAVAVPAASSDTVAPPTTAGPTRVGTLLAVGDCLARGEQAPGRLERPGIATQPSPPGQQPGPFELVARLDQLPVRARRGRASVHFAYGESLAVLAGDALIVLAFQALSDPTRRRMVERLSAGPATVSQLAAPLPMSMSAVMSPST